MPLPFTINSGNDGNAAPVQGNFEYLDTGLEAVKGQMDNLAVSADTYDNGVFTGGLLASQVSTALQYTPGGLIVGHVYYYKTTLFADFSGYAADTYYVEIQSDGTVTIDNSTSESRTNLNTVVWNGSGFDSVTIANRNILYGDDQFVALAGRSGGQTIQGGNGSGEHLVLESTSHGTKGTVKIRTASVQEKVTNQTSPTLTLDTTHSLIVTDTTSNPIEITLPDANTVIGQEYTIYCKTVNSSNDVTINCVGDDTFNLNGDNRLTLTEEDFVVIKAIAANRWFIKINNNAVLSTV